MLFWFIALACYGAAIGTSHAVFAREKRKQFPLAIAFAEAAATTIMIIIVAGWRRWELISWTGGKVATDANVVAPTLFLFAISSLATAIAYFVEKRRNPNRREPSRPNRR